MPTFDDKDAANKKRGSEPRQTRMNPRTTLAATPSGIDVSANKLAELTAAHERTALQPVDHHAVFTALDNPQPPTEKLRAGLRRHREIVSSR